MPIPRDIFPLRPDKPAYMRQYGVWKHGQYGVPTYQGRSLNVWVRQYNQSVAAIDDGVGKLLQTLDETNQRDNARVVFTSDQGFAWGQHGFAWKVAPYDANMKVPLIMRLPGVVAESTVCRHPMGLIDLVPTYFALAEIDAPWEFHGHDLGPILNDPASPWAHPVMLEHFWLSFGSDTDGGVTTGQVPGGVPWWISLRYGRYKYIRTLVENEIEELYDLEIDPEELRNLAVDVRHYGKLTDFHGQLLAELERTGASLAGNLPPPRVVP